MQNKVCVITGATSGIGKATAIGLAKKDAQVIIIGRDSMQGEIAQNEIKSQSGNPKVDLLLADLSSQAEIRKLAEDIQERYQTVDVLINNAGIAIIKKLQKKVEHLRVRLFNLVKEHNRVRPSSDCFCKLSAFFVTNIPRRRSDQSGNIELFHVFRHINTDHRFFITENRLCECSCKLRFTNPCWA